MRMPGANSAERRTAGKKNFRKKEGWVNKAGALPAPQNQMIHGESKTPAFSENGKGEVEKFSEIYIKVNYI